MKLDKLLHLLVGAVIALALGYVMPIWYAFTVAAVVGLLKEVYDHFYPKTNTSDGMDFLATAAGGLVAAVYVFLIPTLKGFYAWF